MAHVSISLSLFTQRLAKAIAGFLFLLALSMQTQADTLPELRSDTTAVARQNLLDKVLGYFRTSNKRSLSKKPDFSIIGGPHYSNDTKLGLGLVAAGLYSTDPVDSTLFPSNFSLYGDVSSAGFYLIGIKGNHIFPHDSKRINYNIYLYSFTTYFWGIGYDDNRNNDNKTPYRDFRFTLNADWLWHTGGHFYLGPAIEYNFIKATHIKKNEFLWNGQDHITHNFGVGFNFRFDTRDHPTNPYKGFLVEIDQRFYPRFLFNSNYNFSSTEFSARNYTPVWKGGTVASIAHLNITYGNTPWGLLPSLGGSSTMRGYYEGRYRDKTAADITVELRQHIYGRSGAVVWAGAGCIQPSLRKFRWRHILPNYGVGYRWEFKKRTNVRLDLGFGKGEWGFLFNINEAF